MYTNRLIIDSEENDDWMKTLPGYKDELALFDSINVFKEVIGNTNALVSEEKQLPINDKSKSNLIQIRTNIFNDSAEVLAEQVYTGEITIGAWEESMKQAIRGLHTSVAAIAKGGWDNMSFSEWGRLGTPLRNQYKYLHGFAETIFAKKDTISLNAIKARARLYGNAGGYVANLMVAGASIAEQLKFIPRDGTTSCLVSCKCFWSLEVIDVLENGVQVVECIWRLTPAEHCEATGGGYDNGGKDGCVDRNGMTQIIRVDASVKVPSMIGGY